MTHSPEAYVRRVEPLAADWRHQAWAGGAFDAGRRGHTPVVEGVIRTPQHVVMVTLRGGARRLEVTADCGHRHQGPDRAGAVSFVPAHCGRQLAMQDVEAAWASIALDPDRLRDASGATVAIPTFSNVEDPFVVAMAAEFEALHARDGGLDPVYCEAMAGALAEHLIRRHLPHRPDAARRVWKIAPWRLKRIRDYVEANLDGVIRIADLAEIADLSPGYFHRAFRITTGQTPLAYINERRVRRAETLIREGDESLAAIAQAVGFVSPSHFTRTFRRIAGANPSLRRRLN